jgi:hypothetical protein
VRPGRSARRFVLVELRAEVCPGEPLDGLDALGVFVGGLGDVVAGDAAEAVFSVEEGEQ